MNVRVGISVLHAVLLGLSLPRLAGTQHPRTNCSIFLCAPLQLCGYVDQMIVPCLNAKVGPCAVADLGNWHQHTVAGMTTHYEHDPTHLNGVMQSSSSGNS